jgi:methionyl-tRNA synthetase
MTSLNQALANAWIFYPLLAWALAWKGFALWYAARRGQKVWYVVLLLVNTLGILEIVYIFAIVKRPKAPAPIASDAVNKI